MSKPSFQTLLSSIRRNPSLPPHSWYLIAGVTLSALNRPDDIPNVFQNALELDGGSTQSQICIARRMREALIKSAQIGGLPRSINALLALKEVTPQNLLDKPLEYSPTRRSVDLYDIPSSRILQRGQSFFDQIYGKVAIRVMHQMEHSGTEDLGIIARLVYGYILSNDAVLSRAETSFVIISCLIPQDVNPQLKGHLKGALNNGASIEAVRAVREAVIHLCKASGMKRLDTDVPNGWGWKGEIANL